MSAGDPPPMTFDFGERLGLVFISQAACLSAASILALLFYIWFKTASTIRQRKPDHADLYFFSLMVADLLQAIGGIMNLKWVADAQITEGTYCVTQGAIKQGDIAVALSAMALAVDTFAVLFFRWHRPESRMMPLVVIGLIWLFFLLSVTIPFAILRDPSGNRDYYGNTVYWCWIRSNYAAERIALEYVWMWSCAFVNILLYIPLFFRLRGNIIVDGWSIRIKTLRGAEPWSIGVGGEDPASAHARKMLWYPAIYIMTVIPIAIVRWSAFSDVDADIPFAATSFADVLFGLSGFFNVVLFTWSRPGLLPVRHKPPPVVEEDDGAKSLRPSLVGQLESYGVVHEIGLQLERGTTYGSGFSNQRRPHTQESSEAVQSTAGDSQSPLFPHRIVVYDAERAPHIELM